VGADVLRERAARAKPASRWDVERRGHLAAQHRLAPLRAATVASRLRGEERLRVRVRRSLEHLGDGAVLDYATEVHHGDVVRDVRHDRQLVRDEEDRDSQVPLDLGEQVEDLGLYRHVQGADRLVREQHVGLRRQCSRDRHPLSLSAGQRPRAPAGDRLRQAHTVQQLPRELVPSRSSGEAVHDGRLRDRVVGVQSRVQRRVRILVDELDPAADIRKIAARQA
jgi:hypothetical protein